MTNKTAGAVTYSAGAARTGNGNCYLSRFLATEDGTLVSGHAWVGSQFSAPYDWRMGLWQSDTDDVTSAALVWDSGALVFSGTAGGQWETVTAGVSGQSIVNGKYYWIGVTGDGTTIFATTATLTGADIEFVTTDPDSRVKGSVSPASALPDPLASTTGNTSNTNPIAAYITYSFGASAVNPGLLISRQVAPFTVSY